MLRAFSRSCQGVRGRVVALGLGLLALALPGVGTAWAHPAKGSAAPVLAPMTLLQAPAGVRAEWASLKGKVVVLEFWATWCSPCIASLPHLNEMVASLDPGKFQFISIDDEDLGAVKAFLTKKKMAGWVGVDTSGGVLRRYGVTSRPTTVIVDGSGKVVAVTEIDSVNAADLRAVAEGKKVSFKPAMEITETKGTPVAGAGGDAGKALFSVSVSKAAADAKMSMARHEPTGTDYLGQDAESLVVTAFDAFEEPYVLKAKLPEGRFDLRVNAVDVSKGATDAAVQQAVMAALHLQVQLKTVTKAAYVLRALDSSKTALSASASTRGVKRMALQGKFLLMNGTMDDLAYVLGKGMEHPVINETGVDGRYDVRFEAGGGDLESVNAVLRKTLGLELVPGGKEMSMTVNEVSGR